MPVYYLFKSKTIELSTCKDDCVLDCELIRRSLNKEELDIECESLNKNHEALTGQKQVYFVFENKTDLWNRIKQVFLRFYVFFRYRI